MATAPTIPVYGATGSTGATGTPTTPTTPTTTTTAPAAPTATPTATVPPTTTTDPTSGTSGNFPGATNADPVTAQLDAVAKQLAGMTTSQFFAWTKVASTEQNMYLTASGGLNQNALYLAYYKLLPPSELQNLQDQMVSAHILTPADANGLDNATASTAFQSLLGSTALEGTNPLTFLQQQSAPTTSAYNNVGDTISANLTAATKNATTPEVITQTNPTTLSADITSAFEQSLGYAPDQAQIQSFISQIQGQETTYGNAPRQEAQDQITQAHSEDTALNKLGPNGLDSVIQAYQAAVNGTKMPGAGTTQGPVNGATPIAPNAAQAAQTQTPGTPLGPGDTQFFSPQGHLIGANVLPTANGTKMEPNPAAHNNFSLFNNQNTAPQQIPVTQLKQFQGNAPTMAVGTPNSTPTHGGLFALSAADWKKAQTLLGKSSSIQKYATPGQAPAAVQQSAVSELLQNEYDNNGGSWSKAVSTVASGTPFGTAEGTHLSAFGTSVANEVTSQIASLQSEVNNDAVTVKVSQPDATAEANLAAKQSDPSGYEAAQSASWGEVLNKMLSGTPSMYNQSTADTFTGPVSAQEATAQATAPTTVGAGGV